MSRFFYPNLHFEDELANPQFRPSGAAARVAAELAAVMALLTSDDDKDAIVVLPDDVVVDDLPESLSSVRFTTRRAASATVTNHEFIPWGWSEAAIRVGRELGCSFDPPSVDAVRFVNSREFSVDWDWCVDSSGTVVAKSFGSLCRTMSEVQQALSRVADFGTDKWVIKSNISHAARNRIVGQDVALNDSQQHWLTARLDRGEPVCVEPWVERIAECGLQFQITRPADVKRIDRATSITFLGATEMLTHHDGRYAGSVIRSEDFDGWWLPAIAHGFAIAAAAQSRGFHGALGIDCMLFRKANGQTSTRLAHDINGRLTMGRVALAMRRLLEDGQSGVWLHASRAMTATITDEFRSVQLPGSRVVHTSPARINGQPPGITTLLLVCNGDPEALLQLLERIQFLPPRLPLSRCGIGPM